MFVLPNVHVVWHCSTKIISCGHPNRWVVNGRLYIFPNFVAIFYVGRCDLFDESLKSYLEQYGKTAT